MPGVPTPTKVDIAESRTWSAGPVTSVQMLPWLPIAQRGIATHSCLPTGRLPAAEVRLRWRRRMRPPHGRCQFERRLMGRVEGDRLHAHYRSLLAPDVFSPVVRA